MTNRALELTFVARLGWGIAGAAWATVFAQALAAGACLLYLKTRCSTLLFARADLRWDRPLLRRAARFSMVSALHMCSLYTGKLLVQGAVNGLGASAVAAFTAATRLEGFANSFGDSGACAMSVFIGQNTGAEERVRVRQGFFTGQKLLGVLGAVMSLLMLAGARPLLIFVLPQDDPSSFPPALGYLRLVACFYLFNFLGSGLAGYFQGRGQMYVPVLGATGHLTLRVVVSFLLTRSIGLPAVPLACCLGWISVLIFWWVLFCRDQRRYLTVKTGVPV